MNNQRRQNFRQQPSLAERGAKERLRHRTLSSPSRDGKLVTHSIQVSSEKQLHPIQMHSAASNAGGRWHFSQPDLKSTDYHDPRNVIKHFQHTDRSQQKRNPASPTLQIHCMKQGKQPPVRHSRANRVRKKYRRDNKRTSDFEENEVHYWEEVNDLHHLSRSKSFQGRGRATL